MQRYLTRVIPGDATRGGPTPGGEPYASSVARPEKCSTRKGVEKSGSLSCGFEGTAAHCMLSGGPRVLFTMKTRSRRRKCGLKGNVQQHWDQRRGSPASGRTRLHPVPALEKRRWPERPPGSHGFASILSTSFEDQSSTTTPWSCHASHGVPASNCGPRELEKAWPRARRRKTATRDTSSSRLMPAPSGGRAIRAQRRYGEHWVAVAAELLTAAPDFAVRRDDRLHR